MKTKAIYLALAAMLVTLSWVAAWPQATLARVEGKVTEGTKPLAGVQVKFTNLNTGKAFKSKTGKDGSYAMVGLDRANYQVEVSTEAGDVLFTQKKGITAEGGGEEQFDIDITAGSKGQPKMTKEQIEAIKAQNAKAENMNELIGQAMAALNAKNWDAAVAPLQQLTLADPNRWQFYQALANAQANLGQNDAALENYEKGIKVAQGFASGQVKDPKNPDSDPVKSKAGVGQMLEAEGNIYLKLKKTPEAIAAFEKAASMSPNPGVAYFNLCATQYNTGNMDGAAAACDKAIAADPNRADAYFIKGSAMFGKGKMDPGNKWVVPPGTAEALNKYLELAPDGPHANDVKQMLQMVGAKIETTYKAGKKKK